MKQPAMTATATVKESERVVLQIQEVERQQVALRDELGNIDRSLDLLAGQEEVDEQAVANCLSRKQAVLGEIEFLQRRVTALQQKKAATERAEAGARLEQIVEEAGALVRAEGEALSRYSSAVHSLIEQAQALAALHIQDGELTRELVYLLERYGFNRPNIPRLGSLPEAGKVVTEIAGVFSTVHEAGFGSSWTRKRQELSNHPELRQHLPKESVSVQASQSQPLPVRETRTIPARPQEDEPQPNKLQQLLRG